MARDDYLGRRKFPRLKNKYLVCFRTRRIDGSHGYYDSTLTRDISAGGMNIIIDQDLAPGTELDMTLRFPLFPGRVVAAKGVVVHAFKESRGQKLFKTRVKFIDFDSFLLQSLNTYIDQEMQRRVDGKLVAQKLDRRKSDRRKKARA